jgi:hypothetical protein
MGIALMPGWSWVKEWNWVKERGIGELYCSALKAKRI